MNLHEYQAKQVFRAHGVPVPEGIVCHTPEDAAEAYTRLGTPVAVVKAQVHAGGRGKAGGVKVVKSNLEAQNFAQTLLGERLVTHQTDSNGQPINSVYVEAGVDIQQELYVAILLNRETGENMVMASTEGGMDIEEVAEKTPEKIFTVNINPTAGFMPYQARLLAFQLGLKGVAYKNGVKVLMGLYQAYVQSDADMLEINPLVVTGEGEVVCLDGKMSLDGNALFRQKDLEKYDDPSQRDPREREADKHDLAYVGLEGNVGCLVNGAGLAMATMDIVNYFGTEKGVKPANFLDVGGGATQEKVTAAFKIILDDPAVEAILVNIFGGIMKCDVIAEGIVAAAKELGLTKPLVVRLQGTNFEKGREILRNSGLTIRTAENLDEAAQKVVAAVTGEEK